MLAGQAVVTGGGRGLGAALCHVLLGRGYRVVAVVRDERQAPVLAAAGVRPVVADVSSDDSMALVQSALTGVSSVDLLVNNAAIIRYGTQLEGVEAADVLDSINTNCLGALRMTRACLPWLRRAGRAVVVNVSTRHASMRLVAGGGVAAVPVSYSYRVSKAALNMLTAAMYQELSPLGVDVAAVHPGRLDGRNAPPDAELSPDEAARRICDSYAAGLLSGGRFLQPGVAGVTELEW